MFPPAVEFATHFSWMDTWILGPSATFPKADARSTSPAEQRVGVSTQAVVVKSQNAAEAHQQQPQRRVWLLCNTVISLRSPNQAGIMLRSKASPFVHWEKRISRKKFQTMQLFSELSWSLLSPRKHFKSTKLLPSKSRYGCRNSLA